MEQFEQPLVVVELDERRDRGMRETAIGLRAELFQLGRRQRVADEGRHHRDRGIDIGQAGEVRDLFAREARPRVGQVQAAVRRQAGEGDVAEIEGGGGPAGADVAHGGWVAARARRGNGGFSWAWCGWTIGVYRGGGVPIRGDSGAEVDEVDGT